MIWWSFPIAEIMSVAMTTYFLVRINRKIICHIGESTDNADITAERELIAAEEFLTKGGL